MKDSVITETWLQVETAVTDLKNAKDVEDESFLKCLTEDRRLRFRRPKLKVKGEVQQVSEVIINFEDPPRKTR